MMLRGPWWLRPGERLLERVVCSELEMCMFSHGACDSGLVTHVGQHVCSRHVLNLLSHCSSHDSGKLQSQLS